MDSITPILEQLRPLIAPLNDRERLTLIQAIATLQPAKIVAPPPKKNR